MISQMNVVQNAARLAMDHRAADPRRGRLAHRRSLAPWIAIAGLCVLIAAASFGLPV